MAGKGRNQPHWKPMSFLDNLAAGVDALGFDNVGVAWGLARVRWDSVEDRELFLNALVSKNPDSVKQAEMEYQRNGPNAVARF